MRFTLDIQFFASKKGVGSTKNGRDSHSKRLGAKLADGQSCQGPSSTVSAAQKSTRVKTWAVAVMTHCSPKWTVSSSTSGWARTGKKFLFIPHKLNRAATGSFF